VLFSGGNIKTKLSKSRVGDHIESYRISFVFRFRSSAIKNGARILLPLKD